MFFKDKFKRLVLKICPIFIILFFLSGLIVYALDEEASFPVYLDDEEIISINSGAGLEPEDRAYRISKRISNVAKDRSIKVEDIKVINEPTVSEFFVNGNRLFVITDKDAQIIGVKRDLYADDVEKKLKKSIINYRKRRSIKNYALAIVYTILTTFGFIVLQRLFWSGSIKLLRGMTIVKDRLLEKFHLRESNIISAKILTSILKLLLSVIRVFLFLVVLVAYFIILLGFFPGTKKYKMDFEEQINDFFVSLGSSVLAYIPHLLFIIFVTVVVYYINQIIKHIFSEIKQGNIKISGFYREWVKPTDRIIRFIIWAMAFATVFPHLPGASSGVFKGVSVFIGILISLGSTAIVANIIAGILLIYTRAYRNGDFVKIADNIGSIQEGTLLVTRLKTVKNVIVSIPNSVVLGSHIINYSTISKETGIIIHTEITIGYDVPWREVHRLMYEAAEATANILGEPKPFILQKELGNYSVTYELNAYTDKPQKLPVIVSDLHKNIMDKFNEADVEVLSPAYIAVRNGNKPGISEIVNFQL